MAKNNYVLGIASVVLALAALVVGILTWLAPFNPIGPSPLASRGPESTTTSSSAVASVESQPTRSIPVSGNCAWVDGQDPTRLEPYYDVGRGISDWNAHYNTAANSPTTDEFAGYFNSRMLSLSKCLGRDDYAKAYADVSVILAKYGREN